MLGTDAFRGRGLDLQIVLSALKAHHRTVTLNSTEETHCLVSFVSNIFLAAVRDPYTHLENIDRMLLEGGGVESQREGVKHYSLKNITGSVRDLLFQHPVSLLYITVIALYFAGARCSLKNVKCTIH